MMKKGRKRGKKGREREKEGEREKEEEREKRGMEKMENGEGKEGKIVEEKLNWKGERYENEQSFFFFFIFACHFLLKSLKFAWVSQNGFFFWGGGGFSNLAHLLICLWLSIITLKIVLIFMTIQQDKLMI